MKKIPSRDIHISQDVRNKLSNTIAGFCERPCDHPYRGMGRECLFCHAYSCGNGDILIHDSKCEGKQLVKHLRDALEDR